MDPEPDGNADRGVGDGKTIHGAQPEVEWWVVLMIVIAVIALFLVSVLLYQRYVLVGGEGGAAIPAGIEDRHIRPVPYMPPMEYRRQGSMPNLWAPAAHASDSALLTRRIDVERRAMSEPRLRFPRIV